MGIVRDLKNPLGREARSRDASHEISSLAHGFKVLYILQVSRLPGYTAAIDSKDHSI